VKLPPVGHGGEGRRRLGVASMVGTYCSGTVDWRFCLISSISRLPDGLEKIISSHPSGWALLRCSKPNVAKVAAVIRWCMKMGVFRIRALYLGGDDEDDRLECDLGVRCVVLWVYIVFSFFLESFVIGFSIVEFHQLLSKKKPEFSAHPNDGIRGPNSRFHISNLWQLMFSIIL
jgi:hypothetical protein